MIACPICATECTSKYGETPYWICGQCDCWHQSPMPPKTYIAEFEGDPSVMSDGDKAINRALADRLFNDVMKGKPGLTLDIGAKLPVMAAQLAHHGCIAQAMDAEQIEHGLPVKSHVMNFEDCYIGDEHAFNLVTMIHMFEHVYDPLAALHKLRLMIADSGRVFLRLPLHDVPGFERDLTPGHYSIHPFYHSMQSILEALVQTNTFVIESIWRMDGAGQGDIVLRPL